MATTDIPISPEVEWSRPQMQRRELGPMFHEFGHRVYDQAESELLSCYLPAIESIQDVTTFTRLVGERVERVGLNGIAEEDGEHSQIVDYVDERRTQTSPYGPESFALTTLQIGESVVKEGLKSGVIVPIKTAVLIHIVEDLADEAVFADRIRGRISPGAADNYPIKAQQLADIMRRPEFSHMLHSLAHAPNGYLGTASLTYEVCDTANFRFITRQSPQNDMRSMFVFDADNKIVDWSPEFYEDKATELLKYNQTRKTEASGGCPVRHADFKVIGETATRYLQSLGNEDGQVSVQGESMIDRSIRMMSTLLEASAKPKAL